MKFSMKIISKKRVGKFLKSFTTKFLNKPPKHLIQKFSSRIGQKIISLRDIYAVHKEHQEVK